MLQRSGAGRLILFAVSPGRTSYFHWFASSFALERFFFYSLQLSCKNTSVEAVFVRDACGKCYVQYRILKAAREGEELTAQRTSDNENISPIRFIWWDVMIFYKGDNKALSDDFNKHHDGSQNCTQVIFRLQGQLIRKLIYKGDQYDGVYFDAKSAVAIGHPSSVCKQPKEAIL
jgi:hypothetical protein